MSMTATVTGRVLTLSAEIPINLDRVEEMAPLSRAALARLDEIQQEPRGVYHGCAHTLSNPARRDALAAQRRDRGFDDSELWNLDQTLAAWLAPRVRRFAEITHSHPIDVSYDAWQSELKTLADGLDALCEEDDDQEETVALRQRALEILARRLPHLWS